MCLIYIYRDSLTLVSVEEGPEAGRLLLHQRPREQGLYDKTEIGPMKSRRLVVTRAYILPFDQKGRFWVDSALGHIKRI